MRQSLLLSTAVTFALLISLPALAGPCDGLKLDLEKGTLGPVSLKHNLADVKKALPCAPETVESMAGTALFFAKQGFYITPGESISVYATQTPFKGMLSQNILNKPKATVEGLLGAADYSAREEAEAGFYTHAFYTRSWGTLMLKYSPKGLLEELTLNRSALDKIKKQFPEETTEAKPAAQAAEDLSEELSK